MTPQERLQFEQMQRDLSELKNESTQRKIQQISYPLDEVSRTIIGGVDSAVSTVGNMISTPEPTTITISGGVIDLTQSYHTVATEGGAASDDVDTINDPAGFGDAAIIVLRAESSSQTVVLKDGTGNLRLAGDCTLDHNRDTITLIGTGGVWYEVTRSNNDA